MDDVNLAYLIGVEEFAMKLYTHGGRQNVVRTAFILLANGSYAYHVVTYPSTSEWAYTAKMKWNRFVKHVLIVNYKYAVVFVL